MSVQRTRLELVSDLKMFAVFTTTPIGLMIKEEEEEQACQGGGLHCTAAMRLATAQYSARVLFSWFTTSAPMSVSGRDDPSSSLLPTNLCLELSCQLQQLATPRRPLYFIIHPPLNPSTHQPIHPSTFTIAFLVAQLSSCSLGNHAVHSVKTLLQSHHIHLFSAPTLHCS